MISLVADERYRPTTGTETTGTTNAVEISIGRIWKIVVDSQVDTLNIDTTTEHIGSDTNTLVEVLELLITLDTEKL